MIRLFIHLFSLTVLLHVTSAHAAGPHRETFRGPDRYLVVETLDDNLIHLELAGKQEPQESIYITPMVARKEWAGPKEYRRDGNAITTARLRVTVEPETLCVRTHDLKLGKDISRICGDHLERTDKLLRFDALGTKNVYGLGNYFADSSTADGDWIGREWKATGYGNIRRPFDGAAPSESQFPVFYALGSGLESYGFFFDHPYRMDWDFRNPAQWTVETWGDRLRWFLFAGDDLKSLRRTFMELTGFPPIPPRSTFGLWVSKFGYLNWDDLRLDLDAMRKNRFPVDGFALDLQWFGGTFNDATNARMGSLWFDDRNFPKAEKGVRRLLQEQDIRLMLVEESYVDERLPEHRLLQPPQAADCFLARKEEKACVPVRLGDDRNPLWWGRGGMIDWTDDRGGKYWHDLKRKPLSLLGITSHWLDLGEPEMFDPNGFYHGVEEGKQRHIDIHNLYNFKWAQSIHLGYRDPATESELQKALGLPAPPRYFIMTRAGAPGLQRLGAGMWSGDIGRNMGSLRAHLNTQLHMSLAGMDYYNSDVGGFIGTHGMGIEPHHTDKELYTQWFANSALGEIPLRPHGWSYSGEIPTFGPDRQGHPESNRANLLQRYELFPYLYSLAHRANRYAEPIFPPLVYHYQDDTNVRRNGNVKMIGKDMLFGVVIGFGQTERRVYLPKGRWIHYNTNEWFTSTGGETPEIPLYMDHRREGEVVLTLPLFARSGAIIPVQAVDGDTLNISGRRVDGTRRTEMRVKVYADPAESSFTLYEDDGETLAYERGAVRETLISQVQEGDRTTVEVSPAKGTFEGAVQKRPVIVELMVDDAEGTAVWLNTFPLPHCTNTAEDERHGCWRNADRNVIYARAPESPVTERKTFLFRTRPRTPIASAHFVCDSATTQPGEGIYVTGNIPELGEWDPARALPLLDIRYPRWAGRVRNLPPNTSIEWKCLKRSVKNPADGILEPGPNHSITTPASGFAGTTHGSFEKK